jgi:hypothetical protein
LTAPTSADLGTVREFDSQHVLNAVSERGLKYVVPKRMQTSEKAQAKRLLNHEQDYYTTDRGLHLENDEAPDHDGLSAERRR